MPHLVEDDKPLRHAMRRVVYDVAGVVSRLAELPAQSNGVAAQAAWDGDRVVRDVDDEILRRTGKRRDARAEPLRAIRLVGRFDNLVVACQSAQIDPLDQVGQVERHVGAMMVGVYHAQVRGRAADDRGIRSLDSIGADLNIRSLPEPGRHRVHGDDSRRIDGRDRLVPAHVCDGVIVVVEQRAVSASRSSTPISAEVGPDGESISSGVVTVTREGGV